MRQREKEEKGDSSLVLEQFRLNIPEREERADKRSRSDEATVLTVDVIADGQDDREERLEGRLEALEVFAALEQHCQLVHGGSRINFPGETQLVTFQTQGESRDATELKDHLTGQVQNQRVGEGLDRADF